MNEIIKTILEGFKHLARDILFYVLSGLLIIANVFLLDLCFNKSLLYINIANLKYTPILIVLLAFVIGHVIIGFMAMIIDITEFCKCKIDIDLKKEILIFKKDIVLYDYYIERWNQLYYLRLSLSGSFLVITIMDVAALIKFKHMCCEVLVIIILLSVLSFIFLCYAAKKAKKRMNERINEITELSKDEKLTKNTKQPT